MIVACVSLCLYAPVILFNTVYVLVNRARIEGLMGLVDKLRNGK